MTLAETELLAKDRTLASMTARKETLLSAKNTPYTYQHIELMGNNFASESLSEVLTDLAFSVKFTHVDPLVKNMKPNGMGYELVLRQKVSNKNIFCANSIYIK